MTLAPRLIAILLVVGASLWSLAIATRPDDPFSTASAILLAFGLLSFSVISAVGLLLPRGRWARNLARALIAIELGLAVAVPLRGWAIAALAGSGAAVIGIQGRWLDGWLRRLPAAQGPGLPAILFALGTLGLVPLVGAASPEEISAGQAVLAVLGIVISLGYSQAQLWALWAGRLLLPIVTVVAAGSAPLPGAIAIACGGLGLTLLAWARGSRLAISPLMDELPGPRRLKPKPEAKR